MNGRERASVNVRATSERTANGQRRPLSVVPSVVAQRRQVKNKCAKQ